MNKRLLLLNGLAILGVVANHASHRAFVAMFWWTDRYRMVSVPNYDQMGSPAYYGLIAAQKWALFSVPSFLFVSGIFISYATRGSQSQLSWPAIKRRILNLLPAYIIWCIVYFASQAITGVSYTPAEYLLGLLGVQNSPYFYIPLLIEIYLLSFWLVPLARKHPKLLLLLSGAIFLSMIAYKYMLTYGSATGAHIPAIFLFDYRLPTAVFFEFFFYYVLGLVWGFHLPEFKSWLVRGKWVWAALLALSAVAAIVEAEWMFRVTGNNAWYSTTLTIPTTLFSVSLILSFMAFDQVSIPFSNTFYKIGSASLGIYLIHQPILIFLPKIIYHAAPWIMAYQSIFMPVLVGTAIGIPMLMMSVTRWSPFRSTYRYLYG